MITFFKRLREQFLQSGQVSRYLLYAVGEIFLVVIGILIALQVNNWNEARREAIQEQQVILSLHNEFEDNLEQLHSDILRLDSTVTALKKVLALISVKEVPPSINIDSLISSSLGSPTWNPSSYVLNDLKNSGRISRLTDPELQRLLFAWERHYENTLEISHASSNSSVALIKYIIDHGSLRNVDAMEPLSGLDPSTLGFNNRELLKDRRFENYVNDKFVISSSLLIDYHNTVDVIEKLLSATE